VRAGLKADIGDTGSLLLRYAYAENDDPRPVVYNTYVDPVLGVGTSPDAVAGVDYVTDPDLVALDRPTYMKMKSHTVQATLELDLGFADMTSYSQYRTEDVDQSQDLDGTARPVFNIGIPVKNETVSQEFLFNSKPGGPLQWTAGLFYFSNKDRYQTFFDTFGAIRDADGPTRLGGSSTTTKSYAAFVDATYELTPQLFVTAGARYAHDTVTNANFVQGPATNRVPGLVETFPIPSIKNDKVTPRFVLRYKPSDQASIYASYTQGYKAAVLDAGGTCQNPPDFVCNDIKPEKVDAFEVGAKFDNGMLSLEGAAFYYDYKNLQVSSFLGDGRAQITNAANSEIYGVEGSARVRVTPEFELNAGASWTHARYKNFENAPVYMRCADPVACGSVSFLIPAGTTLSDVTMQRTPEFTGNIGASYRTDLADGELRFSGNLYYTSKFYFGPSGIQFPQKGYEVATARVQWTDPSDSFTVAIWGDNLTNNRHLTAVQYNSFGLGASWNAPVTYGVELGFRF
jgi:iron complex outermembrane receptor protein